jgi:hypothetical protein
MNANAALRIFKVDLPVLTGKRRVAVTMLQHKTRQARTACSES